MKANINDNYKTDPRFNIVINFQRTMKFVIHNTVAYWSCCQHHKRRSTRTA